MDKGERIRTIDDRELRKVEIHSIIWLGIIVFLSIMFFFSSILALVILTFS